MTDHRAEAERWLWEFHEEINHVTPSLNDMLRLATIHALLAGPPRSESVAVLTGNLTREQMRKLLAERIPPDPPPLDEAMPTISRDDVPAGTLVYAPGPSDVLAYVNGKWWRQVKTT